MLWSGGDWCPGMTQHQHRASAEQASGHTAPWEDEPPRTRTTDNGHRNRQQELHCESSLPLLNSVSCSDHAFFIICFNVAHIPNSRTAGARWRVRWRAIQSPDKSAHYAVMNLAARVTTGSAPVGASSVSIIHFYDSPDNNLSS